GNVDIPARGMIYVFLGAVNRDPARYPEPDRLDIERDLTHHLAFSFGAYYCIGAALARTEVAVGIRTLLDRSPTSAPPARRSNGATHFSYEGPKPSRSSGRSPPSFGGEHRHHDVGHRRHERVIHLVVGWRIVRRDPSLQRAIRLAHHSI